MPVFFNAEFWSLANPELWVGVGLLLFVGVVVWVAKAPQMIAAHLDAQAAKIQTDLDEAARLRAEAEAMLADIRAQREDGERQAGEMLAAAKADAIRLAADAKVKLEDQIARRAALAERKIASAEAQAATDVKAAAADLAARAAEHILAARLASATTDPQVDGAIKDLATRLQ
ncbi:MAG: F0F1 ATP synthase subunit B [Caulobacter sp.]|nr:F0F1 ATP synthase subunit B [Caulobacter sp.]